MRVIIIHGTCGSPEGNWFPWIKSELEKQNIEVIIPRFPTPENQSLKTWTNTFEQIVGPLLPTDILIGHSIGVGFVCRVLENSKQKIKAAVLVAGFSRQLGNPDFDPLNRTFVEPPFNWSSIRTKAEKFLVLSSDNDPYVPLNFAGELSSALDTELTIIPGSGHLNAESGYLTFPYLLKKLEGLNLA